MLMNEKEFWKLVKDNQGFEVTLGFREDVDHFIGGLGNKVWYFIQKKNTEDFYVCTENDGVYSDVHFTRKKKILTSEAAPTGKTMELILAELAIGQKEIESSGRKPVTVEVCEHPCSHYSFAFGERAYKVSDEYGVTIEYSNLSDEVAGFRLRNLKTGKNVKVPKET